MGRTRNRCVGFSLLELMISISILGVVTALGTSAYVDMTGAWYDTKALTEMDAAAGRIFDTLEQDITRVMPVALSMTPIRSEEGSVEDARFRRVTLADDLLVLPVLERNAEGLEGPVSIMYRVDRGEYNFLTRTTAVLGSEFPKGSPVVISSNYGVLDLRFEFATDDAEGWAAEWRGDDLPRAIRASLTLTDGNRPHLQISRKAVFYVPVH